MAVCCARQQCRRREQTYSSCDLAHLACHHMRPSFNQMHLSKSSFGPMCGLPAPPGGMALVPFRVAGAAADQSLETRLFQVGGHALSIRQDPRGSGALRTLQPAGGPEGAPWGSGLGPRERRVTLAAACRRSQGCEPCWSMGPGMRRVACHVLSRRVSSRATHARCRRGRGGSGGSSGCRRCGEAGRGAPQRARGEPGTGRPGEQQSHICTAALCLMPCCPLWRWYLKRGSPSPPEECLYAAASSRGVSSGNAASF